MTASSPDTLLSTVEETLGRRFLRFRILVVGNSRVGKSSLISNIFNICKEDIDVADSSAGHADIDKEYTSYDNPYFALHDSKGFQPGTTNNLDIVKDFIHRRCKGGSIKDQLHAIWLCLETPRKGSRLMQTADEDLLKSGGAQTSTSDFQEKAEIEAKTALAVSIETFEQQAKLLNRFPQLLIPLQRPITFVPVSTEEKCHSCAVEFLQMLEKLTKVTQKCLRTKETLVPWAIAQQPKQKVECSLEEGFKKYMKNLGKSTVFKGHVLLNCILRLHLDIVKVWNFRDPEHFPVVAALAPSSQTALCLDAYIVDLTLVLHKLFITEQQQPLTSELVSKALKRYKDSRSEHIHQRIRNIQQVVFSSTRRKEDIRDLIQRELGMHGQEGDFALESDDTIHY
ncbi:hypothetical protein DXG01_016958 [Tephrocybe rancida]|nr:hypothetical protein DXG01_016958 [Tephrocybe rancida]